MQPANSSRIEYLKSGSAICIYMSVNGFIRLANIDYIKISKVADLGNFSNRFSYANQTTPACSELTFTWSSSEHDARRQAGSLSPTSLHVSLSLLTIFLYSYTYA